MPLGDVYRGLIDDTKSFVLLHDLFLNNASSTIHQDLKMVSEGNEDGPSYNNNTMA